MLFLEKSESERKVSIGIYYNALKGINNKNLYTLGSQI